MWKGRALYKCFTDSNSTEHYIMFTHALTHMQAHKILPFLFRRYYRKYLHERNKLFQSKLKVLQIKEKA
jgi:hypothetical protein